MATALVLGSAPPNTTAPTGVLDLALRASEGAVLARAAPAAPRTCRGAPAWTRALLAIAAAGQIADAHSTRRALQRPGNYEGNPAMRGCVQSRRVHLGAKGAVGAALWYGGGRLYCHRAGFVAWTAAGLAAVGWGVAVGNYRLASR